MQIAIVALCDPVDDAARVARILSEENLEHRRALFGAFIREKEGLVRALTAKYAEVEKSPVDFDDLLQAARTGLMRAVEGWDPEKGALSTYAGWWVWKAVQQATHAEQPIALPRIRLTNDERKRVILAVRENPDVTAAELGIAAGPLEQVKKSIGLRFVSVDMFGEGDDEAPRRARKVERRINEATSGDELDAEDALDRRSAAARLLDAARVAMGAFRIAADDLVALVAHGLGASAPYPEGMAAPKKTSHASPHSRQPEKAPAWKPLSSPPNRSPILPMLTTSARRRPLTSSVKSERRPLRSASQPSRREKSGLSRARMPSGKRAGLRSSPPQMTRSGLASIESSGSRRTFESCHPKIASIFGTFSPKVAA